MQTAQTFNSQHEYDSAVDESPLADSIETECGIFAGRFVENQMDPATFFELAEAFGSEEVGNYLGRDDQHNLLQLVLKHSDDPIAKALIDRLKAAAYDYKEKEYGQQ